VLANLRDAARAGARALNHAPVEAVLVEGGRAVGVMGRCAESGRRLRVRAAAVVNAAGPWVEAVRRLETPEAPPLLHLSKGVHVALPHPRLPLRHIAILGAADKRSIFAIPRGEVVYLGTTDTSYPGDADHEPPIGRADVEYLLEPVARHFDVPPPRPDECVTAWAGLRPLVAQPGKAPTEISRKDEILIGPAGVVTIAGGKLTGYRKMGERILMMVLNQLAERDVAVPEHPRGASDEVRLCGGDIDENLSAYVERLCAKWPRVDGDVVARLVTTYGTNGERMVEGIAAEPSLGERCAPGSPVTRAEVEYAVREEMALTLQDFLDRRARLFLWDPGNGLDEAATAARIMARLLGWSAARVSSEVAGYRAYVETTLAFTNVSRPAEEPQRAALG
jgi:glycerol-3-phosphate dehydrogenase